MDIGLGWSAAIYAVSTCDDRSMCMLSNNRKRTALSLAGAIGLMVLVGWVFHPVLSFDFLLWDDDITATGNPLILGPWSWSLVGSFFGADEALRFKPVHWVTCKIVHSFFGLNPSAWHAIGWFFHAVSAALVFVVGTRALRLVIPEAGPGAIGLIAWFAAAFWALHPLRVEPVAWVTGSSYPLATCLLLASFGAYLRWAESDVGHKGKWLIASWLLALLAYGTYPIVVGYGVWLIVVDCLLLKCAPEHKFRWSEATVRRWWMKHMLFVVPACVAVLTTVISRVRNPGIFSTALGLQELPLWDRACGAAASAAYLLSRPWGPWEFSPNRYGFNGSLAPAIPAACGFLLLAGLVLLVRRRSPRAVGWALGWLVLSVPCLGLTERFTWPVDRYSYLLDTVYWVGMGGWALVFFAQRQPGLIGVKTAVVVVVMLSSALLAEISRSILPDWRESDAFFKRLSSQPDFGRSWVQQAHVLKVWSVHLRDAGYPRAAWWRLGQARALYHEQVVGALKRGDLRRAVSMVTRQEQEVGISATTRRERAAWNLELGHVDQAKEELEALSHVLPDDPRIRALLSDGRFAQ